MLFTVLFIIFYNRIIMIRLSRFGFDIGRVFDRVLTYKFGVGNGIVFNRVVLTGWILILAEY